MSTRDRKLSFALSSTGWVAALALIACGALLRLVGLDTNPPGMWQDEASTGLDAFLIWTTGKDRAGVPWPVIARSFGDYPLAGYRYLAAPIVGLFGLTIGSERLVAAIAGTLMIAATGLLVRRALGPRYAFATVLSAALCPTWIHFSRYGSEAILLPFCLVSGLALLERGREERSRWALWAGAAMIGASAYTYHAVKLFLPIWTAALLLYLAPLVRSLWAREKHHVIGPMLLFAAVVTPSMLAAVTPEGTARGRTVLAWYHFEGWELFRIVLNNYLSYFDPGMLFVRGGPAVAQSIPGLGLWNLIELPFVLIGLQALLSRAVNARFSAFLLFWFAAGPIAGGVTYETHNVGRVIAWLPAPQIISAIGMVHFATWARARATRRLFVPLAAIAWLATAAQVTYLTLVRYPITTERDWQFEISRAMQCAKQHVRDEQIIVAPQFQAAEVFARFHFADLKPLADGKPAWAFGNRSRVAPGELYVFPVSNHLPDGEQLCAIEAKNIQGARAYVYRGHPADDAGTVGPPPPKGGVPPPPPQKVSPRMDMIRRAPSRGHHDLMPIPPERGAQIE